MDALQSAFSYPLSFEGIIVLISLFLLIVGGSVFLDYQSSVDLEHVVGKHWNHEFSELL